MSDSKLVRKVLRSLPSKFNMKVTAIEEANDLASRRKPGLALTSVKEEPIEEYRGSQINATAAKPPQLLNLEHQDPLHPDCTEERTTNEMIRTLALQKLKSLVKESAVMSVKDLDIFNLNVQPISNVKRSLVATLSDEEDYSESDDEEVGMALISIATMNEEEAIQVTSQASDQ
ncbi:gag-pol polyprotein [Cucumis melo var. makuwa]|uniref:Gag-pol polyprotein n=1 Tax=Cucumis melo var. makuwa TaxID=1194695 RepID=A0A5A7URK7_CUCMM|nr:gag-pol polyprotein [Cucumis melo var. makuwa]